MTGPLFGKGNSRRSMDRPLLVGPQYPLAFMSTTYEPDSAFLLKDSELFSQVLYSNLNTYVLSSNSKRDGNSSGAVDEFYPTDSGGYSVYFDGEIDRRYVRLYYGFSEGIELQYTYREVRFISGNMDSTVEAFHNFMGIGNQGREHTPQDDLDVYIQDNDTGEIVMKITDEETKYRMESITLGIKFRLRELKNEAISFTISSNMNDHYIERGLNEIASERDKEHKNFNDFCYSLNYTSLFPKWSFHAGISIAHVGKSLLDKSPEEVYYFFLGANYHWTQNWDLLIQALNYSSPFPDDDVSTIGADVNEVAAGIRWFWGDEFSWEFGFVENQSQGPQNIDITFFSSVMFML